MSTSCTRRAIRADGGNRTRTPFRASVLSAACIPVPPRRRSALGRIRTFRSSGLSRVCLPVSPRVLGAAGRIRAGSFSGLNRARLPISPPQRAVRDLGIETEQACASLLALARCAPEACHPADRACRARGFTSNLVSQFADVEASASPDGDPEIRRSSERRRVELPRVELGRHAYQACKVMTGPSSSVCPPPPSRTELARL